jgi:hypothetical protein
MAILLSKTKLTLGDCIGNSTSKTRGRRSRASASRCLRAAAAAEVTVEGPGAEGVGGWVPPVLCCLARCSAAALAVFLSWF